VGKFLSFVQIQRASFFLDFLSSWRHRHSFFFYTQDGAAVLIFHTKGLQKCMEQKKGNKIMKKLVGI